MAIVLYKNSGFKICDENSFTHELENGWFLSKAKAKEAEAKADVKVKEEAEAKEIEEAKAKAKVKAKSEVKSFKK